MPDQDAKGKFTPGNQLAKGGVPFGKQISKLRQLLFDLTSPEQLMKIWAVVLVKAEEGDMRAVGLVFDRLLGPAVTSEVQERMDELEELVKQLVDRKEAQQLAAA